MDNYKALLKRAQRIKEQASLALAEQPNPIIKYRLENMIGVADELIVLVEAMHASTPGNRRATDHKDSPDDPKAKSDF